MDEPLKDDDKEKDEIDLPIGDIDPEAAAPIIEPEEEADLPADDLGFGGEDEFGDPLIVPTKKPSDDVSAEEEAEAEEEELPEDGYDDVDLL
ncbi:MAG: hypothetical protein V4690_02800 [Patescibacteria group bacterium]